MSEEIKKVVEEVLREQGLWGLTQLLKKEHNLLRGTHNLQYENLKDLPTSFDTPLTVKGTDGDTLVISLSLLNALIKWSDGNLLLQTNEGINANSVVDIRGKGTGVGQIIVLDEDDQEWLFGSCVNGVGIIDVVGTTPTALKLRVDGTSHAEVGNNSADITAESTGCVGLKETTTPTTTTNYGKVYTKNDNKLYFQDGAGVEHEVAYVP